MPRGSGGHPGAAGGGSGGVRGAAGGRGEARRLRPRAQPGDFAHLGVGSPSHRGWGGPRGGSGGASAPSAGEGSGGGESRGERRRAEVNKPPVIFRGWPSPGAAALPAWGRPPAARAPVGRGLWGSVMAGGGGPPGWAFTRGGRPPPAQALAGRRALRWRREGVSPGNRPGGMGTAAAAAGRRGTLGRDRRKVWSCPMAWLQPAPAVELMPALFVAWKSCLEGKREKVCVARVGAYMLLGELRQRNLASRLGNAVLNSLS